MRAKALASCMIITGMLFITLSAYAQDHDDSLIVEPVTEIHAEDEQYSLLGIYLSTGISDKYMFRGVTYSEDPVIWQTVSGSLGSWTAIAFGKCDIQTGKVDELDGMLQYALPITDNLTGMVGYGYFHYPGTYFEDGHEVYGTLSLSAIGNPILMVLTDLNQDNSNLYAELCVSHNFEVGSLPLLLSATLGYNNYYFREDAGFSHVVIGCDIPIKLSDKVTATLGMHYNDSLPEFEDEGNPDQTWFQARVDWIF